MLNISEDRLEACTSFMMQKGWLSSFAEFGNAKENSGGPTVLFICESLGSTGIYLITGASKSKLKGYPQLERVVNQNRTNRFFSEEQEEIRQKTASNRSAAMRVINDPHFIERMRNQFRDMREWETAEGYWKREKRLIDDEVAKYIKQIKETPTARNEEAYKARKLEIQNLKQNWKGRQDLVQAKTKDAQKMARRAKLEITGIARQCAWHLALPLDYWDHKSERGVSMLSDRLQRISPCWMCHSIYRFNQWQQPSGVNWKGNDHEEGRDAGVCAEAIAHAQSIRSRSKRPSSAGGLVES